MSRKTSLYVSAPIDAVLTNRHGDESLSGRIAKVCERYADICARNAAPLTDEERMILGNCLSGSVVEPLLIRHLADEVADSEFADSDPGRALVGKLRGYSVVQLTAIVESVGF